MMIVDLLRNDMNRISEVGSEHVERFMPSGAVFYGVADDFDYQESVTTGC